MRPYVQFVIYPRIEEVQTGYSAYCDELGMAACAATRKEAEDNLVKTVETLCRVLRRRGILAETLTKAGIDWHERETDGLLIVA